MKNKKTKRFIAILLIFSMLVSLGVTAMASEDSEKKFKTPERVKWDTQYHSWLSIPEESVISSAVIPEGGIELGVGA